jgi:hypothetical protein
MNFRFRTRPSGCAHRPVSIVGLAASTVAIALLASFPKTASGRQLLSPPAAPIDVETSTPIRQLLTEQWERDPVAEAASKDLFRSVQQNNANLLLAYSLNRIQHNRVDDAKSVAEEMTKNFPKNLDGWMLLAWLNTLSDRYDTALINLRSMKKQIDKNDKLSPASELALYKRLGRLIGYMQGPVADRVNDDIMDGTVLQITAGLPPEALKTFHENRNDVLKQFDALLKSQGQKTQVELAKVKIQNDNETIALEREIQLFEQTESQLIPEKQRLRQEATRQISIIEQQAQSLEQQLANISSDIRETEQDLQYMAIDLFNAQNLPPRLRPSLFYLQNQIRNAQLALSALRSNGNQVSNQLGLLRAQIIRTQNAFNQQVREIDKEIKRVNGAKRRNLAKLARLAAGPEVADGKKDAMRNKATALRTYDEFPLLIYRQELLEKLTDH